MKNRFDILFFILLGSWFLFPDSIKAQDSKSIFQTANTYYQNKQYQEAEKMYSLLIKKDKNNANAYYNLGNTYYHLKQFPNAIYNYEKARKLDPDNKYTNHNIELTNNKLFSKIEFSKEFFVAKEIKSVVHTKSSKSWSILMLAMLWIGTFLLFIHFLVPHKLLYRIGILSSMCAIVLAFITFFANKNEQEQNFAIIIQKNAFMKSAPVESMNAATIIQTGLKVEIIDSDKNWRKIKLPNDKTGWIEISQIELI